jgi:RNA polymerase sigma-70 factor (ECF subfamily)
VHLQLGLPPSGGDACTAQVPGEGWPLQRLGRGAWLVAGFSGQVYFSQSELKLWRAWKEVPTSSIEKGQATESIGVSVGLSEDDLALRFTERLRLFAARRLNDISGAEDVTQETLRIVVEAIRANRVENRDSLPGFVFQTARNICLHWIRSTAREKSAFARLEREPTDQSPRSDPLVGLVSAERAEIVKAALDHLSAEDKRLLTMIYYGDLTSDEIALTLGVTTAAVRVRKHRALQRLAVELRETIGNENDFAGTLE